MRRWLLMATALAALAGVPTLGRAQLPASDAASAPPVQVQEQIDRSLPVREATSVYLAPDEAAETHGRLAVGREVQVVATLVGGGWVQVRLPDETVGYVKTTAVALPSANGGPPPAPPAPGRPTTDVRPNMPIPPDLAAPAPIDGRPLVRDTATLVIDGRAVLLAGIEGVVGEAAGEIQDHIAAHGDHVSCTPKAEMPGYFTCLLADGTDLARLLLRNGIARIAVGAPDDYAPEQDAAVHEQRGIWKEQASCAGWTVTDAVATVALTDDADEGLYFVDREPFVLLDGEPVAIVFDAALGWGWFDAAGQWTAAPARWRRHLENVYPHGTGLRDAALRAHDLREGPARDAAAREAAKREPAISAHHALADKLGRAPVVPENVRPAALRTPRPEGGAVARPDVHGAEGEKGPVAPRPAGPPGQNHEPPRPSFSPGGPHPTPGIAPPQARPAAPPAFHAMPITRTQAPGKPVCKKGC